MSHELFCPLCGEAYRNEDFCPEDGMRLAPRPVAKAASAPPSASETPTDKPAPEASEPATETEAPASDQTREKLFQFMNRLGLRAVASKATLNASATEPETSADEAKSPLPDAVIEKGWKIAGPVQSGAATDRWPVERQSEDGQLTGNLYRYRTGALTSVALYSRIEAAPAPGLVRIVCHGTTDIGGARADYDLVSPPTPATGLDKWFAETPSSEDRGRHLFPQLVRMLQQLAVAGVRPIVFEPSQLLRIEDGNLCLSSAGALADVTAHAEYHPEFTRSALLPHCWTAPELIQQTMLSENAAVFCVGQVLAQAVWGQPCSYAELQSGAVPFQTIADARLARVLMGCLWPTSLGRWTCDALFQAADYAACEAMPTVSPWASRVPGASSKAFSFAGLSFWRLEDLLTIATRPAHWQEATHNIGAILEWAESTNWVGKARLLLDALVKGRSADWALVALSRAVRPVAPMTWRDLDLSDTAAPQSLVALGQRALQGGAADVAAMRDLFGADLRGAFASSSTTS